MLKSVRSKTAILGAIGAILPLLVSLSGCDSNSSSTPAVLSWTSYRLLVQNEVINYTETLQGKTNTEAVTTGSPATINGITVFPLTRASTAANGANTMVTYVNVDISGNLIRVGDDELTTNSTRRYSPPITTPPNLTSGQVITQTVNVTGTGVYANVTTETIQETFQGFSTVTVPGGSFQNTATFVDVTTLHRSDGTSSTQTETVSYAPGIGVIQTNNATTGETRQMNFFTLPTVR